MLGIVHWPQIVVLFHCLSRVLIVTILQSEQISILYSNLSEKVQNTKIIAAQISPDIESSKLFYLANNILLVKSIYKRTHIK